MTSLLVLALSVVTALATITPACALPAIEGGTLPPKQFDRPFRGNVDVVPLSPEFMGSHHGIGILAFVWSDQPKGQCVIHILRNLSGRDRALIIRHEIGHCNGWGGDHRPRGRS